MFRTDDTIAAISTAAGNAARAVVRLSGPDALSIAADSFTPAEGAIGFRAVDGVVKLTHPPIEMPARAYVFRSSRSYTRQDVVELHVPGPAAAASALAEQLIRSGARQAEAGEFTARAFFAGRIDLSQAQAVADIVNAADDAQARSAAATLGGRVHRLCESCAAGLADVLAAVEASIDLADENIQLDDPSALADRLESLASKLRTAGRNAADINETADAPRAVLAGRPNVGKSSLLNVLSDTDRAIVSAMAGTTRDVLTAPITLGGAGAVLQDAAGFVRPSDQIAAEAGNAARRAIARADALLFVIDLADESFHEDLELLADARAANRGAPVILLANKADLLTPADVQQRLTKIAGKTDTGIVATSAVTGTGMGELKKILTDMLHLHAPRSGAAMGLHARQRRCLLAAADATARARGLLREVAEVADVAELAAVELRGALGELAEIGGQIVTEDILGRIFARFCVGK